MRSGRVTIRAKLYVAILLSVLGPVITIAVALHGMNRLGDRFDEVQDRAARQALALDLKFGVTDVNGWQTAYGYDNGASRGRFTASAGEFRRDLSEARRVLTDPVERRQLGELEATFEQFMRLDEEAFLALERGDDRRVKRIFLGPELDLFEAMAIRADDLAGYEARRDTATEKAFDDSREDLRRALIAVALGAVLVIILLLVTASDIARTALEGGRAARTPQ
jgi:methyl-accepting chemotaxis protein